MWGHGACAMQEGLRKGNEEGAEKERESKERKGLGARGTRGKSPDKELWREGGHFNQFWGCLARET